MKRSIVFIVASLVWMLLVSASTQVNAYPGSYEERILEQHKYDSHRSLSESADSKISEPESLLRTLKAAISELNPSYTKASTDVDMLNLIKGTKWQFTYTIISSFTDTISFGSTIRYVSGDAYLDATNEYGHSGIVIFYEGMYGCLIDVGGPFIFEEYYIFTLSGNTATGSYSFDDSDFYPMTGVKVSGPTPSPPPEPSPPPGPNPAPGPTPPPGPQPTGPAPTSGIWQSGDGALKMYVQTYQTGSAAIIVLYGGQYGGFLDPDYSNGISVNNDVLSRGHKLSLSLTDASHGTLSVVLPVYGLVITPVALAFEAE